MIEPTTTQLLQCYEIVARNEERLTAEAYADWAAAPAPYDAPRGHKRHARALRQTLLGIYHGHVRAARHLREQIAIISVEIF